MSKRKRRISDGSLCEYFLINFPGLLGFGEVIKEVSAGKFLAR